MKKEEREGNIRVKDEKGYKENKSKERRKKRR